MPCIANNCGICLNCYNKSSDEEQGNIYDKIMSVHLFNRLIKCNCYMCEDKRSACCYELNYYLGSGMINNQKIKNVNTKIQNDRKKAKKKYILRCIQVFITFYHIYNKVLEKRYSPGGNGYIEAYNNFNNCLKHI